MRKSQQKEIGLAMFGIAAPPPLGHPYEAKRLSFSNGGRNLIV
jgi:hypothetical protein